jgi:N-methylhydantoinase B
VSIDGVRLEVWWSRLTAIVDEAASAILRTAFSTIIRESNDYTVVLMNSSGARIADCRAGIPAFAVLIGSLTRQLLTRFPVEEWLEGNCVITNDPWMGTGHLPDMAMVTPIFRGGTLVGFAGTVAHLPDIGGTSSMGPTELVSEGLLIPPVHLYRAGRVNHELVSVLRGNVRLPAEVWGDLQAQLGLPAAGGGAPDGHRPRCRSFVSRRSGRSRCPSPDPCRRRASRIATCTPDSSTSHS